MNRILQSLRSTFLPRRVVAFRGMNGHPHRSSQLDPLFAGKQADSNQPTAYICQDFTCQAPVVGEESIVAGWQQLGEQ